MKQRFTLYASIALMFLVWLVPRSANAQLKCPNSGLDSIQQVCIDIACGPRVTITWPAHASNCYSITVHDGGGAVIINQTNLTGKASHSITFSKIAAGLVDSSRFTINEQCGNTGVGNCNGTNIDVLVGVIPPLDSAGTWKFENTDKTGLTGRGDPAMNTQDSAVAFTPASPTNVPDLSVEATLAGSNGTTTRPTCTMGTMSMDAMWTFGATFKAGVLDSLTYCTFTDAARTMPTMGSDSVGTKILSATDTKHDFKITGLAAGTYYTKIIAYAGTCRDSVIVTNIVHPGADEPILACHDKINLSVDGQCMAEFNVAMILAGSANICGLNLVDSLVLKHGKTGAVIATVNAGDGNADTIRLNDASAYIHKELVLEVHSTNDTVSNWCWGLVLIEDKLAPILTRDTLQVIPCYKFTGDFLELIKVKDCDPDPVVKLTSKTIITDCPPGDSIMKRIIRTFTATDKWGNTSSQCTDTLDIRRLDANITGGATGVLDIHGLKRPLNRVLVDGGAQDTVPFICDSRFPFADYDHDHIPDPVDTLFDDHGGFLLGAGVPTIDTVIDGVVWKFEFHPSNYVHIHENVSRLLETCKTAVTYSDLILPRIGCVQKVVRTWTIREWACGQKTTLEFIQFIEIVDTLGPSFDVPANMKVTTNLKTCERYMRIPPPTNIIDFCKKPEFTDVIVNVINGVNVGTLGTKSGTFDPVNGGFLNIPLGLDTVIYCVFDDCHNVSKDTLIIEVVDETPPVVICKDRIIVGIAEEGPMGKGEVWVPATVFDNGTYDDCGLKEICVARMDDLDAFDALEAAGVGNRVGDEHGPWYVPLSALVTACGRQYEKSGTNSAGVDYIIRYDLCTPKMMLCCADVDSIVMVVVRATDKAGNKNECMVEVEAQDKRKPQIHCPPDLTIDCRFDFASDSLGNIFGEVVEQGQQQNIDIPPHYILGVESGKDLVDGVWFGNCSATVTVTKEENIDQCRQGYIMRTFIVTSNNGSTAKCKQKITLSGEKVLKAKDIRFPNDTTFESCADPSQFGPDITGNPWVTEDDCTLIGWGYEDLTVRFNNNTGDACFKIIRQWTVIDWCKAPSLTLATGTQIIKINDIIDPVITGAVDGICPSKTVDALDNKCKDGFVELFQSGTDNCTEGANLLWTIAFDADDDGDIDAVYTRTGATADISGDYPIGTHRLTWEVRDQCGNDKDVCVQMLTVRNIKEPTPVCITTLTGSLMPVDDGSSQNGQPNDDVAGDGIADGGMLTVWAKEYDIGSSVHPCDYKLVYSFAPDSIVPSRDFTCADLQVIGLSVHVIALDKHTLEIVSSDFCSVVFNLNDNNNTCDTPINNPAGLFIRGNIHTEWQENVPTVEVNLDGVNAAASTLETETDLGGMYAFVDMPLGGSYSVAPTLNKDILNGVSTLDLVLIQKHILGLQKLTSPYKIIAGDINRDRNLSAVDLVELRRVILGITSEFRNNDSWRFVDGEYAFDDPHSPLKEAFRERYDIFDLSRNMIIDFVGIKVGDVNGSVNVTGLLTAPRSSARLSLADVELIPGQTVRVPVSFKGVSQILGYQFTMEYDQRAVTFSGFESGSIVLSAENFGTYGMDAGLVTTSWGGVNAVNVSKEDAFVLEFEVHKAGRLSEVLSISSSVTASEAYSADEEVLGLTLEFTGAKDVLSSGYELFQNTPNPFSETTSIGFMLPIDTEATISIYDVTGKLVKEYSGSFAKGLNTIDVDKAQLNAAGVLYYTLDTEEFTSTRRMVLIK